MADKVLVIDANILIRAVLGLRVRRLLETHSGQVVFVIPESAYAEAEAHVISVADKRGLDAEKSLRYLRSLSAAVAWMSREHYSEFEPAARPRLVRDPDDWPIVAAALALDCPIWTEDQDFFGCGVATWNSATIDIFLAGPAATTLPTF